MACLLCGHSDRLSSLASGSVEADRYGERKLLDYHAVFQAGPYPAVIQRGDSLYRTYISSHHPSSYGICVFPFFENQKQGQLLGIDVRQRSVGYFSIFYLVCLQIPACFGQPIFDNVHVPCHSRHQRYGTFSK